MYALGLDVGGTAIKGGVINSNGKIVIKFSQPIDKNELGASALKRISVTINKLNKKYHLKGIGIGMPGILDLSKGSILLSSTTLNKWKNISITKTLEKYTKLKTKMSNDANVAALAEARFGKYKNANSLLLITLGTGVGGGVVMNHQLLEGNLGQGMELGHMSINQHGRKCGCGRVGCLETYTSATALACDASKALKKKVDAKEVFRLAKNNNKIAKKVINDYVSYLGDGLLNYCVIFKPEVILLSGGVAKAGNALLNPLNAYLKKHHYGIKMTGPVKVDIASLKYDSGVIGAASLIL